MAEVEEEGGVGCGVGGGTVVACGSGRWRDGGGQGGGEFRFAGGAGGDVGPAGVDIASGGASGEAGEGFLEAGLCLLEVDGGVENGGAAVAGDMYALLVGWLGMVQVRVVREACLLLLHEEDAVAHVEEGCCARDGLVLQAGEGFPGDGVERFV